MKSLILILAGLLVWAPLASADNLGTLFGAMATAEATGKGQTTINGTVGFADVTSWFGGVGYGFTDRMDGRVKLGIIDESAFSSVFILGGDLRWQLWDMDQMATGSKPKPFDLALGGFFEWSNWEFDEDPFAPTTDSKMTALEIGFQVTGSKTFQMSNGSTLTPYGRLNIRNENISVRFEDPSFGTIEASDSQIALGANAGLAWGASEQFVLFGELQIDGNDGLFLGVDYRP